jgi:hypothetical protein
MNEAKKKKKKHMTSLVQPSNGKHAFLHCSLMNGFRNAPKNAAVSMVS